MYLTLSLTYLIPIYGTSCILKVGLNIFLFRKAKLLERQALKKAASTSYLDDLLSTPEKSYKKSEKFSYTKCFLETIIIGKTINIYALHALIISYLHI